MEACERLGTAMGVSAALGGAMKCPPQEQQIAKTQGEAGEYEADVSLYLRCSRCVSEHPHRNMHNFL